MKQSEPIIDEQLIEERAVRLLSRREHGRQELQRKLEQKGCAAEPVNEVLERLAARGWQSDERYVESFTRQRIQQGHGPLRIKADLQQRQVTSVLIEAALAELAPDWFALAEERLCRRFHGRVPATPKERAKQQRYLLQRGFTPDQVQAALKRVAGQDPDTW